MADTDQMKTIADFWTKTGNDVSAAQQKIFKDFADGMSKALLFPILPFASGSATIENAGDSFRQLILSSLKVTDAISKGTLKSETADGLTTELLQKIFDPREWLSATGYMDETVRRITEGPKFSDLGQIENKALTLFQAFSETRRRSLEQSSLVLAAWTKAVSEFASKLNEAAAANKSFGSRSEIVSLWVEIGNRHLLEVQRSPPYLETQRALLQASSNLKLAQQDIGDFYNDVFGLPTRVEIDDLTRTVAELKRELRTEKRRWRSANKE
jgi:hypothetical protein